MDLGANLEKERRTATGKPVGVLRNFIDNSLPGWRNRQVLLNAARSPNDSTTNTILVNEVVRNPVTCVGTGVLVPRGKGRDDHRFGHDRDYPILPPRTGAPNARGDITHYGKLGIANE